MTDPQTPAAPVAHMTLGITPAGAAGLPVDPWALTPEQQAELDAKTARTRAELAAIPDFPPF